MDGCNQFDWLAFFLSGPAELIDTDGRRVGEVRRFSDEL